MVLGLIVMLGNVLLDAIRPFVERFVTREIALGAFFALFVTVAALFMVVAAVKLTRWTRAGGGR